MSRLLASVSTLEEARLALHGGADLIDLKQPRSGALGALPDAMIARIVAWVDGRRPVSATIGDRPMIPADVARAARAKARAGADLVKVGFFPGGDWPGSIRALGRLARAGTGLVAVLFADRQPDLSIITALADAGFTGAMLDTQDKGAGGLLHHLAPDALAAFVMRCHARGLLCGLAGSLGEADIDTLRPLGADYLGFRTALCAGGVRTERIDAQALARVRRRITGPPESRQGLEPATHAASG